MPSAEPQSPPPHCAAPLVIMMGPGDRGRRSSTWRRRPRPRAATLQQADLVEEPIADPFPTKRVNFGLDDRGRIAPGMRADLVMVEGDPTTDIYDMRSIDTIWKNGFMVDRTP